ncbi:hypothetical protein C1280_15430 [Gemmata obscuriglobus]|uniref:Uncharacterized protein n=2 Tax=Gemmata obscuriglobus TaxID=114 RepID=A0A2Z3H066_9BACT|nr:hypothetical protein C1280_15430 [Gemmata obscuriglobus]
MGLTVLMSRTCRPLARWLKYQTYDHRTVPTRIRGLPFVCGPHSRLRPIMPPERLTIPDLLQRGADHFQANRLREARDACEQVLRAEPVNPHAAYLLGLIAHKSGNYADAARWLRLSVAVGGANPAILNNLGEAYRAQGRLAEALRCFQEGIRLAPGMAQLHNNCGLACHALGRVAEAAVHFSEAVRVQPEYAKAHRNLGRALQDLGRAREAWACFDRAQACGQWPENTTAIKQ